MSSLISGQLLAFTKQHQRECSPSIQGIFKVTHRTKWKRENNKNKNRNKKKHKNEDQDKGVTG